jgi:hypothetical protein
MEAEVETKYVCPVCNSSDLFVYEETSWLLNTGEFFCHSVKMWDSNAKVTCRESDCEWVGELKDAVLVKV